MKSRHAGFTLIELLVVISIIALLSSVILTTVNTARAKARDASIKTQLSEMRKQAALFYATYGSYGGALTYDDSIGECRADLVSSVFDINTTGNFRTLLEVAYDLAPKQRVFCAVSAREWAFALPLNTPSAGNTGWCVDSRGAAREVAYVFTAAGTPLLSGTSVGCW